MNKIILIIVLTVFAITAGILFTTPKDNCDAASPCGISVADAYNKIQKNKELVIIDVREPDEYAVGHIEKSILLPLGNLEQSIVNSVKNKSTPLLVYCRSGNRSKQAQVILLAKGYTNVTDMRGGFTDWVSSGYPVVK